VAAAVLGLVALAAGPGWYAVREDAWGFPDQGRTRVVLVERVHDGAPQLVVIADDIVRRSFRLRARGALSQTFEGGEPPVAEVDVPAGRARWLDHVFTIPRDATIVRLGPSGATTSSGPPDHVPGAGSLVFDLQGLEDLYPTTTDPVLRAAIDGVSTIRCWDRGPGPRLLATIDHGALAGVAVIDSTRGTVPRGPLDPCDLCALRARLAKGPPRWLRVLRTGAVREAPPPTLDEVRAALAAVKDGTSVQQATAGWPGATALWAP
jgi:hypothetical protein